MNTKQETLAVGDDILVFVPNEGWLNGRVTEPVDGSGMYGIHGPAEGRFAHPRRVHRSAIIKSPGFQIIPNTHVEVHLLESEHFPVEGWYIGKVDTVHATNLKVQVHDYRGHLRTFLVQPQDLRALEKTQYRAPRKTSRSTIAQAGAVANDPWAGTAGTVVSEAKYVAEDMDFRIVALEAAKELLASSNIEDIMRLTNFILTGRDND